MLREVTVESKEPHYVEKEEGTPEWGTECWKTLSRHDG